MNKESSKYGINRKLGVGENRIKILFVCHGNICRSPMCEFILKDMIRQKGLEDEFYIESCATSTEEIGRSLHPGAKRKLDEMGIPNERRRARQLTREDYDAHG